MESYNKSKKVAEAEEVGLKIWHHIHFKAIVLLLTVACLSLGLFYVFQVSSDKRADKQSAKAQSLQVGVYMTQNTTSTTKMVPTKTELADFDKLVGKHSDTFVWHQTIKEKFDSTGLEPIAANNRKIQLIWEPKNLAGPTDQPYQNGYRLADIISGSLDQDITRWAIQLRDFPHEVLFTPMPDMNTNLYPWSAGHASQGIAPPNFNKPGEYVPAWNHIYAIFKQANATNVKFVWSPYADSSVGAAWYTLDTYYPGNNSVNYIGLDGYNFSSFLSTTAQYCAPTTAGGCVTQWKSFKDIFQPSYDVFTQKTNNPFVITETASTEKGGNKADWILSAYKEVVSTFPRVTNINWYNAPKNGDGTMTITSSANSLGAYQKAMTNLNITPEPTPSCEIDATPNPVSIGQTSIVKWAAKNTQTAYMSQVIHLTDGRVVGGVYNPVTTNSTTNFIPNEGMSSVTYSLRAGDISVKNCASVTINILQKPSIKITDPLSGASVSKTIPIQAIVSTPPPPPLRISSTTPSGSSESAPPLPSQVRVDFFIDGQFKGSDKGTVNIYSYKWDTRNVPNGSHNIKALYYGIMAGTNYSALLAQTSIDVNVNNMDTAIYHFLNTNHDHFYTADANMQNDIEQNLSNTWWYKGISFFADKTASQVNVPVYHFYIPKENKNYYTIKEDEKDYIMKHLSGSWQYYGIAFYAYKTALPDTVPVYQYYNPIHGGWFYTTTADEGNRPNITSDIYYVPTGIAFYAYNNPDKTVPIPTTRIIAPKSASDVKGTTTVIASTSDNTNINKVDFYVDGKFKQSITQMTDGYFKYQWNTLDTQNGKHIITAKAYDKQGRISDTGLQSVTINVANNVPEISTPADGATVSGSNVFIRTSHYNIPISKIAFFVDDQELTGPSYKSLENVAGSPKDGQYIVWDSRVKNLQTKLPAQFDTIADFPNGNHKIKIVSTDNQGKKYEDVHTVNVQNTDVPVYTLKMPNGHNYLTTNINIKNMVASGLFPGWQDIGASFRAYTTQVPNTYPVWYFYDQKNANFYYTQREDEKNYIMTHIPSWSYKGIAWYAYNAPINTENESIVPVYLVYNLLGTQNFDYWEEASYDEYKASVFPPPPPPVYNAFYVHSSIHNAYQATETQWQERWDDPKLTKWQYHTYDPFPGGTGYSLATNPNRIVMTTDDTYGSGHWFSGWGMETKQHFNPTKPIVAESKVRMKKLTGREAFSGITIYLGESNFREISLIYNAGGNNDLRAYRCTDTTSTELPSIPGVFTNSNLSQDQFYDLKIEYDGAGTWRYYVDGNKLYEEHEHVISEPPNIFILTTGNMTPFQAVGGRVQTEFQELKIIGNTSFFAETTWIDFHQNQNVQAALDDNECMWQQCDDVRLTKNGSNYSKKGTTTSPSFTLPTSDYRWEYLTFAASKPNKTDLKVQVLDAAGNLLPDTVLPGNRNGFTQPINLLSIDKRSYPTLKLKGTLTTSNLTSTPKLLNWSLKYTR